MQTTQVAAAVVAVTQRRI